MATLDITIEAGIKDAGLWSTIVNPLTIAILAPLVVQSVLQIFKLIGEFRQTHKTHQRLISGIRDEIDVIHRRNAELMKLFSDGLANGTLQRKMQADRRYFIYVAEGGATHQIFDMNQRDFTFMRRDCLNVLREFYDTQLLLTRSVLDLKSDLFRELSKDRKITTLSNIVSLFQQSHALYETCVKELERR